MIQNLSSRLQDLRNKYNLSQKQVADILKISPSVVSAYETGERTPSTPIILKLASLYNCSTDYLLGKTTETPPVILDTNGLTEEQIQVLQSLIKVMRHE